MSITDASFSARAPKSTGPGAGAGPAAEAAPTVANPTVANPAIADSPPSGIASLFYPFTNPLSGNLNDLGGSLTSMYKDLSDRKAALDWLKQVYDGLVQTVNARSLVWEGPGVITGWPTNPRDAFNLYSAYLAAAQAAGKKVDVADSYYLKSIDNVEQYYTAEDINKYVTDNGAYPKDLPWTFYPLLDQPTRQLRWLMGDPPKPVSSEQRFFTVDGRVYHLEGNWSKAQLVPVTAYIGPPSTDAQNASALKQLGLELYGDQYLAETQRLKSTGLPIGVYDAYQYSIGGKTGYTTVSQILTRDSPDFSGVADGTIVAVGTDYYLVNKGNGQKLQGAPEGILMGMPAGLQPQGDVRYQNAIVATLGLVQGGLALASGDYDMCMYAYGSGQVGYAKLPPVVVSADPQTGNALTYPPGTLLKYTDGQNNVSYYRVTGTGVAKIEDPSTIARTVTGNPPDLGAIDAGTLVRLDDGRLYWVTKDKKTTPAVGTPLLGFMSPEQKANWDGIQVTEALQEAGLKTDGDADTCVYIDKNNNTVFTKWTGKVFDGPGAEPSGKDYVPGDVVESRDGSKAWYIDDQGKAQPVQSRIEVKESNVPADEFDPSKYSPGDVVGTDDGSYYRITTDHQPVRISYPLEKLICKPSSAQIESLQGKLQDLMNSKTTDMNGVMIKLQQLMANQNILAGMISSIVSSIKEMSVSMARNMA